MDHDLIMQLPAGDLILEGLQDLIDGRETIPSLLVSIGEPRLKRIGFILSSPISDPETRLYRLLSKLHDAGAHSKYNSYIRLLVSFERAAECVS